MGNCISDQFVSVSMCAHTFCQACFSLGNKMPLVQWERIELFFKINTQAVTIHTQPEEQKKFHPLFKSLRKHFLLILG